MSFSSDGYYNGKDVGMAGRVSSALFLITSSFRAHEKYRDKVMSHSGVGVGVGGGGIKQRAEESPIVALKVPDSCCRRENKKIQ